ncbi:cell division protein SepF [Lentilactobacillus kosonis]|uniref:Cell division protein SepF n=1 Tax=Lentilactobacillus kosonis TaxID=2810561 RepID=A0A401FNZ8_9LACO|nr:cell division protein SepF [Lentilactobacillus kosonis]GAY74073.1 FtsZ-interacting protein related to cell division [Lentilactobacillus kosonis]
MSQKFNLANFFGVENEQPQKPQQNRNNVVPMAPKEPMKSELIICTPANYSDTDEIAQKLMDGVAVIVQFNKLDSNSAARMVDFLNGIVYAINGSITRLEQNIFICTPANFKVSK